MQARALLALFVGTLSAGASGGTTSNEDGAGATGKRHQAKAGAAPMSKFGWELTYGGTEYYASPTIVLAA